jgi:hypothetical protein
MKKNDTTFSDGIRPLIFCRVKSTGKAEQETTA